MRFATSFLPVVGIALQANGVLSLKCLIQVWQFGPGMRLVSFKRVEAGEIGTISEDDVCGSVSVQTEEHTCQGTIVMYSLREGFYVTLDKDPRSIEKDQSKSQSSDKHS